MSPDQMQALADKHLKYQVEDARSSGVFDLIRAVELQIQAQSADERRDHFAGLALTTKTFHVRPYDDTAEVARDCYRMADAMLKAR